jgi:hypothetical protein
LFVAADLEVLECMLSHFRRPEKCLIGRAGIEPASLGASETASTAAS